MYIFAIGKVANKIFSENKGRQYDNTIWADCVETDKVSLSDKTADKDNI